MAWLPWLQARAPMLLQHLLTITLLHCYTVTLLHCYTVTAPSHNQYCLHCIFQGMEDNLGAPQDMDVSLYHTPALGLQSQNHILTITELHIPGLLPDTILKPLGWFFKITQLQEEMQLTMRNRVAQVLKTRCWCLTQFLQRVSVSHKGLHIKFNFNRKTILLPASVTTLNFVHASCVWSNWIRGSIYVGIQGSRLPCYVFFHCTYVDIEIQMQISLVGRWTISKGVKIKIGNNVVKIPKKYIHDDV